LQQEQEALLHQEELTQHQILEKVHIPKKKCTKRTNWPIMATNFCGKKVQTHQNDEVRYVFIPIEQSYNNNLKNILLWTSFGKEEKAWANKTRLVGLFEVEWKTPYHNILVEFLSH
jgi:hypothetical protein